MVDPKATQSMQVQRDRIPDEIDLTAEYPVSVLLVLKICLPWFLVGVILVVAYLYFTSSGNPYQEFVREHSYHKFRVFYYVTYAVLVGKFIAAVLFRKSIQYVIKDDCFVLSKGIIFRYHASFPLTSINQTAIGRSLYDWTLGLCSLQLTTAHEQSDDIAVIPGLSAEDGARLVDRLRKILQVVQPSRADFLNLQREVQQASRLS